MNCDECVNKAYCGPFKNNSDMRGCGTGIPEFLPSAVAKQVAVKINRAANEMGFDRAEYARKVAKEIEKAFGVFS